MRVETTGVRPSGLETPPLQSTGPRAGVGRTETGPGRSGLGAALPAAPRLPASLTDVTSWQRHVMVTSHHAEGIASHSTSRIVTASYAVSLRLKACRRMVKMTRTAERALKPVPLSNHPTDWSWALLTIPKLENESAVVGEDGLDGTAEVRSESDCPR